MKVQIGVYSVQYGTEQYETKAGKQNLTTTVVANILEEKYDLMSLLAEKSMPVISKEITKKVAKTLFNQESINENLFDSQTYMRHLIKSKAFDGKAGIPTKRSLLGVRSKFLKNEKGQLKRNRFYTSIRPSFIDSGYFITSLHAKLIND